MIRILEQDDLNIVSSKFVKLHSLWNHCMKPNKLFDLKNDINKISTFLHKQINTATLKSFC